MWRAIKDGIVGGDYDGPVSIDVHPSPDAETAVHAIEDSLFVEEQINKQGGKKEK
jgi:hypothetical protein